MRVCLDCFPFLVRSAGVKAYHFQLHRHLRRITAPGSIGSFPFLDEVDHLNHDGSVLPLIPTAWRFALLLFANTDHNPVLDVLGTNFLSKRFDLFHASNQVRNPPRNTKLTTTVQDVTTWTHPELHTQGNILNDRRWAERIVKRCDAIIVPSESTRIDAIERLKLHPDRIRKIAHGVSDEYFDPSQEVIHRARATLGLTQPYILFVSTIEPRKNLDRLLDAYEQLPTDLQDSYDLVISGVSGWGSEKTTARLESKPKGVRTLGYVPEALLPGLTAGATVFAYPSLYEGFGFPVAQAMAANVAVLTSHVSSLPEVTGGAAELIDPLSTAEIKTSLERLLLSPALRGELTKRARVHAEHFTWERCARETWQFFENV